MFSPPTITAPGETLLQTAGERLVVDCKVNVIELLGQVRTILVPTSLMLTSGGAVGRVRLNAVPFADLPPK